MYQERRYLFPCIIFLLMFMALSAQDDFDSWQKQQQGNLDAFKQESRKEFKRFKDARDSTFAEFLKQEWQAFEVFQGLTPEKEPKPDQPPVTSLKYIQEDIEGVSVRIEEIQMPEAPVTKTRDSIERLISRIIKKKETIEFDFFQVPLKVNIDPSMTEYQVADSINEETISDVWAAFARSDYEDLLDQIRQIRKAMQLNDWGYALLTHRIAEKLYPESGKMQTLTVWFLMLKSEYRAKVGYNRNVIYLLLPASQTIYSVPYYLSDHIRYYVIHFQRSFEKADQIYTYQGKYAEDPSNFSLILHELPAVGDMMIEKEIRFEYGSQDHPVHLALNKPLIDFYSQYPQTDFPVYFNTPLSSESMRVLIQSLKPMIENKSEAEAVNILLRFVQTAFGYQKDDDQFGYEKPLFADETLFYPFSDCEDRSVLFSTLVRTLLHLDVIGLDYPGHVAAAVKFSTDIPGESVDYQGKRYLVCDPTYIHANIGQCMPKFKTVQPEIIEIH